MIDSLLEVNLPPATQLEQRRQSVEHTAANVYNKAFDQQPTFQWLEGCKKIPLLRRYIDKIQAVQLTMNEQAALEEAGFDSKTGLLNAVGLNYLVTDAAEKLSSNPDSAKNENWAVLFIDINWFKKYNDTLGQSEGDTYLCGIAKILGNSIRFGVDDLAGRHGGEEFVLLVRTNQSSCRSVVDKDDVNNPGILQRIASRTSSLLTSESNEKMAFNQQKSEYDNKSLKEMGVGSLAIGIEYLSGEEVVKMYQQWHQQSERGLIQEDFLNYILITNSHDYSKKYSKQVAHDKQGDTPVWATSVAESDPGQVVTRPIS